MLKKVIKHGEMAESKGFSAFLITSKTWLLYSTSKYKKIMKYFIASHKIYIIYQFLFGIRIGSHQKWQKRHLSNLRPNKCLFNEYNKTKPLNPSKALGPDELHPRVLKELATELGPVFAHLFQQSMATGEIPKEWSLANICPLSRRVTGHLCAIIALFP